MYEKHFNIPVSERICDVVCITFAVWTICCNIMVAVGGTLQWLIAIFVSVCVIIIAIGCVFCRRKNSTSIITITSATPANYSQTYLILQCVGLFLGLLGIFIFIWYGFNILFWCWSVGLLGVVSVVMLVFREMPQTSIPIRYRSLEYILFAIALVCVIVTLISHRPDADDAFYVNIAVASADHPQEALMSGDTLHGIDGLPLHLQVYSIHSFEILNGAMSYITGIPAVYCIHWISAALAGLLVPLAFAKLFRLLVPHLWVWAVFALVFILISTGETHRWYGNFSFVRMWQGKSIFLFVFLPLIYTYALQFSLNPTIRTWILLCAAQIASIGCTSSALWAAPVSAILTMCCTLYPKRESLRVFVIGIFASSYVLGIGWYLKGVMRSEYMTMPHAKHSFQETSGIILGDSNLSIYGISSILLAWVCCKKGLAQRFAVILPFAVLLFIINPFSYNWVSGNMTGPSFWRSMWVMPIPILSALLMISPLVIGKSRRTRIGGIAFFFVFLTIFALFVPRFSGIDKENKVIISSPKLKVPELQYKVASVLNKSVFPGSYVVAPDEINVWIPTFHNHAYPLKVRHYLTKQWQIIGMENYIDRGTMIKYAGGRDRSEQASMLFRVGLDKLYIEGVCLLRKKPMKEAYTILREAGFCKTSQIDKYEIWVRH